MKKKFVAHLGGVGIVEFPSLEDLVIALTKSTDQTMSTVVMRDRFGRDHEVTVPSNAPVVCGAEYEICSASGERTGIMVSASSITSNAEVQP